MVRLWKHTSMLRHLCLSLVILGAGAGHAMAWDSPVPDVVLYCAPALEAPLSEIARRYTETSHVEVHMFVAPPDGLFGLIKHRARADVVVADTPTLDRLAADGLIRPGSVAALGRDPFVLIARDGPAPAASTATVLPDPTTAASFDGRAVLHAATPPVSPAQIIGVSDTPEVATMVREDGLVGLVHATEAHASGLHVAEAVGAPPTPMSGALVALGQSANAAALLAFIGSAQGAAVLRAAGMEPQP